MRAFDPEKVLVIAVGIDRYEQEKLRLTGAAAYAERLANWALAHGIPAGNVLLATSHQGDPPTPPPGVVRREPTYTNIERLLDQAARHDAELLLMYWCGHGVLNEHGERVLFTSDAHVGARHNHVVDEILRFLRSHPVTNLHHQIIVIDACANYLHHMRLGDRLPRTSTLNIGDPRGVEQYVLYSAGQGQSAKHNLVTGTNAFSDTAFEWLEGMPPGPIAPHTARLTHTVKTVFHRLRETVPGFKQTPLTVEISGTALDDAVLYSAGGIPVPGDRYRNIVDNDLEIAHTRHASESRRHLAEWLMANDIVTTEDDARHYMRSLLMAALENTKFEGRVANLDTEALIVRVFSTGQIMRLFELVKDHIPVDLRLFDLERVQTLWLREADIARIERYFPEISRRKVADAYRRVAPAAHKGWRLNITDALRDLADLPKTNGQHPVQRFAAALEAVTDCEVDDSWYGMSPDELLALRHAARLTQGEHERLVVEIPNASADPAHFLWPSGIREHRYTPGRGWKNRWFPCTPTPTAIQDMVNRIAGDDAFALGFLLPRAVFDSFPESWGDETPFRPATPHWQVRPVVLHSSERMQHQDLRRRWTSRHATIRAHLEHNPADLLRWVPHTDSRQIYRAVSDSRHACVGLSFVPPDYCGELRTDPIIAAIRAGAPYILWTSSKHADWPSIEERLGALVAERSFDEFPTLLHEKRTRGNDLDIGVRLLWDDPRILPEPRYLPGMQAEAT